MKTNTEVELDKLGELIEVILKSVVNHPNDVQAKYVVRGNLALFAVRAAKDDGGRVMGGKGKRWNAIMALCAELGKRNGLEVNLSYDEKPFTRETAPTPNRELGISDYNGKRLTGVKTALKHLIGAFVLDKSKVVVSSVDLANTMLIEAKVAPTDYDAVYGVNVTTPDGTDGHIIGAIKCIWYGVLFGRTIKLVLSKA